MGLKKKSFSALVVEHCVTEWGRFKTSLRRHQEQIDAELKALRVALGDKVVDYLLSLGEVSLKITARVVRTDRDASPSPSPAITVPVKIPVAGSERVESEAKKTFKKRKKRRKNPDVVSFSDLKQPVLEAISKLAADKQSKFSRKDIDVGLKDGAPFEPAHVTIILTRYLDGVEVLGLKKGRAKDKGRKLKFFKVTGPVSIRKSPLYPGKKKK